MAASSSSDQSPETLTPSSQPKKSPPIPWTPQETVNLIQAYQEKWYSLNRGQLRANQWEDVAIAVAARCGFDDLSKSSTQCRHKIEKLRKRYRSEKLKPYPNLWQFFDLMDSLERGTTLPIPARPIAMVKYPNSDSDSDNVRKYKLKSINQNSDDDSDNGGVNVRKNKSKSINRIVNNSDVKAQSGKRNFVNELSDEEEERGEENGDAKLAAEIRGFAERFIRMEKMKIEMMRDTGRYRLEMEKRRMDLILETHRSIADSVSRMMEPNKRTKMEL